MSAVSKTDVSDTKYCVLRKTENQWEFRVKTHLKNNVSKAALFVDF